ncbi:hypothetical protein PFTANZ_01513 [Plasmodium falciparum Tanzania (2000708)]|uniref:Uncharacterized protein n=1 Tax=Plasmodium falciparum Tanzania (2000708) TaxID=1036725 RepID=A0A024WBJ3_PLAFA|nr:hypothetical protein PFTANZ_01513 [Plasmodium falciparum Tanzania (2000708)]
MNSKKYMKGKHNKKKKLI